MVIKKRVEIQTNLACTDYSGDQLSEQSVSKRNIEYPPFLHWRSFNRNYRMGIGLIKRLRSKSL